MLQEHALVEVMPLRAPGYPHCCESAELLQELLSRKLQMGACIEKYSDAQRCSDLLRIRDVCFLLFPCPRFGIG